MSRIDRVLINNDWVTTLPDSEVYYHSEGLFDHCPALVRWEQPGKMQQKMFRYFNMWSMASDFHEKVKEN